MNILKKNKKIQDIRNQDHFESTYTLINKIIGSESFKEKHRFSEQYFTRERCLSFSNLILYLLNFRKYSNQVDRTFVNPL